MTRLLVLLLLALPLSCFALEADEILVVANQNVEQSLSLARYYMEKRGIPSANLLLLTLTGSETCSRAEYQQKVAAPIRSSLQKLGEEKNIRCLVTMFGIPLKISAPRLSPAEEKKTAVLQQEIAAIREELEAKAGQFTERQSSLRSRLSLRRQQYRELKRDDQAAALDSELALVLKQGYPRSGWVANPIFVKSRGKNLAVSPSEVLLVSRLDGPSETVVKRIIDDSLQAEAQGLHGTAYFDARWPRPRPEGLASYAVYDYSLHLAAERTGRGGLLPVVLDDKETLLAPGQAPQAALYCGWYRLGRYLDAFDWQPGAIGYHIASNECHTLKGNAELWCKRMLEDGAAATIGPVNEPYVQAFPLPEIFFDFITDGDYTLAEAYFKSSPYLSWQMVLIGDPLYRPFKNRVKAP